jgi:hypothetical protein
MNGILAGTMQTGAGRAVRDGVLGSTLQVGPGRALRDGVLGGTMQSGAGRAYNDGSLGCTGCAGPMQTGPGHAVSDGSLGATVTMLADPRPRSLSRRRYGRADKKVLAGLGGVGLTMDLLIGAGVGAAAVWFLVGKKKG